jgi:hypothetical protein
MRHNDLHLLPRFSDGLTFLYIDRVRVEQDSGAIVLVDDSGRTPVPIAALAVLMLGPGSSVTHAAMVACADSGCSVLFCGDFDGLQLILFGGKIRESLSGGSRTPVNHIGEACGEDAPLGALVEAGKLPGDG